MMISTVMQAFAGLEPGQAEYLSLARRDGQTHLLFRRRNLP